MLIRLSHCTRQIKAGATRLPIAGLAIAAALATVTASRAQAGSAMLYPPMRAPQPSTSSVISAARTPTPTPTVKITTRPHLLAVGPMTIAIKPVAGPRFRQPPLLPTPKPVEPEPDPKATTPEPAATPAPEPSALSPDGAPILLPVDKQPATPTPEKKTPPKESVLTPADHAEQELKDAVMYFDTPVGPNGARATIPLAIPFTSPAPAPQPESRATYRKEKE